MSMKPPLAPVDQLTAVRQLVRQVQEVEGLDMIPDDLLGPSWLPKPEPFIRPSTTQAPTGNPGTR